MRVYVRLTEAGDVLHIFYSPSEGLHPVDLNVDGADPVEVLGRLRFDGSAWVPRDPKPPEPLTAAEIEAEREAEYQVAVAAVEAARLEAYRLHADPLFFKWQAGETTEDEWRAARALVRETHPMPVR